MGWEDKATPVEDGWKAKATPDVWEPELHGRGISDNIKSGAIQKLMIGEADVALSGVAAGVGEVLSGFGGLMALALSGDPDYAKKRVESWQNVFNIGPYSEGGEHILNKIAPSMSKADMAVNDFAEEKATDEEGNIDPLIASFIKAGIWTSLDIAAAVVPGGKALKGNFNLYKMRKQVIAEANRLGIDIHLDSFADDLADAAKMIGSESAGEAAMEYVTALRNAEYRAMVKKNSLYAAALDEKLFVSPSPIRKMGVELTRELDELYDLDGPQHGMAMVRRSLDDMHSRKLGFGSGQNLAVHFNQFEKLRKRVNSRITDTSGNKKFASANSALIRIKNRMDDWMTTEFNKAMIENGKVISEGGVLSGDAAGFQAYLDARKANVEFEWFNETKIIADMIKKDASVDQVAQWLVGAASTGKRGATTVVNKMKKLLGEDHPAIAAVREDFVFNITYPLLKHPPNFLQFMDNYDRVLRKNKPLSDALGLQSSDVAILADYALVASKLPPSGKFYSGRELVQTIARLGVGHGVAKGAARVTFTTKVLNAVGRIDAVTEKQITAAMVDARFGQPFIPKGTPIYAAIVAGAALSGTADKENN
jgi:hypothetical protein